MIIEQQGPELRILCKQLADYQNNNKIGLDLSFQSEERWSDKQRQNYIRSILRRFVPTPITLADVESCMSYCAKEFGEDSDDFKYFKSWKEKGYKYISIDGNNRTRCIAKFYSNKFSLIAKEHKIVGIEYDNYKFWTPSKNNKTYENLPAYVREFMDTNCYVTCFIVKESNLQDLHDLFININDGVQLNAQEKRNAIICVVAEQIRKLAKTYEDFFSIYFSKESMSRRNQEEFIASLLVHITHSFSGSINKGEIDKSYNDNSAETKNLKKLNDVLKFVSETCVKFEKNTTSKYHFIPNEATLFDYCMIVSHLFDKNIKIYNQKDFFDWFATQYTTIKTRVDNNGSPVILWKDSNGQNARDYVGVQRSKDAAHRQARLNAYVEVLHELNEGVIGDECDSNRFFSLKDRVQLWVKQGKKCPLSGEEILLHQVLDGNITEIDHIIPHSKGGKTSMDNAQLTFKHANQSKSNEIPVGSL